ncbi:hypothetical protein [Pseudomonas sp. TCU-HL1]|uniref:hypothetical protein n=1 Tax=Pseudomonas sp. TCU-HL1 TaxID=1856685 RepID=UPI0011AB4D54|nr:hypothetical protein [Pseudomonas sp. TCU-HL1]
MKMSNRPSMGSGKAKILVNTRSHHERRKLADHRQLIRFEEERRKEERRPQGNAWGREKDI